MVNKIPIRNAGPLICKAQNSIYNSNWGFVNNKKIYNKPTKIKLIPPTISYFHDINKTTSKISAGILCINNPTAICQKLNPGEKTSNENNAKNNSQPPGHYITKDGKGHCYQSRQNHCARHTFPCLFGADYGRKFVFAEEPASGVSPYIRTLYDKYQHKQMPGAKVNVCRRRKRAQQSKI